MERMTSYDVLFRKQVHKNAPLMDDALKVNQIFKCWDLVVVYSHCENFCLRSCL